jgi:RNA binding exosome subunit
MEQAESSEAVDAAATAKAEVGYYFFEIEKLEGRLKTDSENVHFLEQLCDLCIKADKRDKALDYAVHGLESFERSPGSG